MDLTLYTGQYLTFYAPLGRSLFSRDLKPENILLDYTGHIALCDFGLCKLNMSNTDTTNSELITEVFGRS
jgi:serine/threonine protein kinase